MDTTRRTLLGAALAAALTAGVVPSALAASSTLTAADASAPAGVASANAAGDARTAAAYLKQWRFDPDHRGRSLYAKTGFGGPTRKNVNLKNTLERRYLQWEHQSFGINLGWTDDATPTTAAAVSRWFFTRKDTTHAIRYGDTVAMGYGEDPSYIRYAERTFGVNLDWSSTPQNEWRLLGGRIGTKVRTGDRLAIYNTVTKQPLIYFDRTVGGDLGWPDSETWGDQVTDAVMTYIKDHWAEGVAYLIALA